MYALDDIIAAISTPLGNGGISIVRLSGSGCIALVDTLFRGRKKLTEKKSHTISYGTIVEPSTQEVLDEVLVSVMCAPHTYTREDIVEINCHGGIYVTQRILQAVLHCGARLAEPGEFTKRGFLNGRMDLTQAEAVMDVIESKTELSRKSAVGQLEGRLKVQVRKMRDQLIDMIASIEALIDYPDDEIEEQTYDSMHTQATDMILDMEKLFSSAERGKIVREGLQTVIVGKPNVGKSSLLNWFLEEERAIVTDIPGTTRDTVEELVNIDGIPIRLVDTAGIRETKDVVEQIGVEKSKTYAEQADVVLMMLDSSRPLDKEDKEILNFLKNQHCIVLLNKSDLPPVLSVKELSEFVSTEQIVSVSVQQNIGLEMLLERIKSIFFEGECKGQNDLLLGNTRHKNALTQAKKAMEHCLETIALHMPVDFISMDLQDASRALGEITGDVTDEEIIDRIFTKFCLGK